MFQTNLFVENLQANMLIRKTDLIVHFLSSMSMIRLGAEQALVSRVNMFVAEVTNHS